MSDNDEYDDADGDFSDEDYGFIISPTGELKTVMFPEDLMEEPPASIKKILKIFGIKDIHDLGDSDNTLH